MRWLVILICLFLFSCAGGSSENSSYDSVRGSTQKESGEYTDCGQRVVGGVVEKDQTTCVHLVISFPDPDNPK